MMNGIFLYFLVLATPISFQEGVVLPLDHISNKIIETDSKSLTKSPTTLLLPSKFPTVTLPVQPKVVKTVPPTLFPTLQSTQVPAPTAQPAHFAPSEYEGLFDQFSAQFGVDKEILKKIAKCESGFNPSSTNGTYGGMFQFAEQTWLSTRNEMGLDANPNLRFSAKDAIETAAYKISRVGTGPWRGCM